jgi:hypothetical protein
MFSQVDATNLAEPGSSDFRDCCSQHNLIAARSLDLLPDAPDDDEDDEAQVPTIIIRTKSPTGMPTNSFSQSHEAGFLAPQNGQALAWSLISLLHSGHVMIAILTP